MRKKQDPRQKLVPLRHFANHKLYSITYLSVLAQRKKLKVKRFGRIYYTTQEWFEQYLNNHASGKVRQGYEQLFRGKVKKVKKRTQKLTQELTQQQSRVNFFVDLKHNWFKLVGLGLGILILGSIVINTIVIFNIFSTGETGRVAGVEEVASSTVNSK